MEKEWNLLYHNMEYIGLYWDNGKIKWKLLFRVLGFGFLGKFGVSGVQELRAPRFGRRGLRG